MCKWYAHQGERVDVLGTFAHHGGVGDNSSVLLEDVYIAIGNANYVYARDHVWVSGRTFCQPKRSALRGGDVVRFNAKVACFITLDNPKRRLGFQSIREMQIIGSVR